LTIFDKKVVGLSEPALNRFVQRAKRACALHGGVNVLITSSAAMRSLNSRFRGRNKPTDVLSFPSSPMANGNGKDLVGDNGEMARKEAKLRRVLNLPLALTERAQSGDAERPPGSQPNSATRGARRMA
jgi:hypothetical protein